MIRKLLLAACAALPLIWSCGGSDDTKPETPETQTVLSLADPNASPQTKALYSNLWAIRDKGWMFGHHDDLMYGRKWYGTDGGSGMRRLSRRVQSGSFHIHG